MVDARTDVITAMMAAALLRRGTIAGNCDAQSDLSRCSRGAQEANQTANFIDQAHVARISAILIKI